MARHRTLLVAGAVLLWFVIATALPAAAPTVGYSDWSAPVNLGSIVNSTASETGPALSADRLSLYFSSDKSGGFGLRDIWVSQRAAVTDAWGTPVHLGSPINTASDDFVPAFSEDGHWMFFASTRPGGFGGPDLYQSYRADIHDDFGWQEPTNLGAGVNTAAAENGNGYFDNGGHPQVYFGSDRLGPAGNSVFWMSNLQADGTWGQATLVPELGGGNRPSVRQDGLEIFFYSNRAGGAGAIDLWTATRATVDEAWSTPVNVGPTVNSSVNDQHPYVSANGEVLVFFSNRAGGSGGNDLWVTTRTVTYASLCALTQSEVADAGIANSLCKKLDAAAASAARGNMNARDGQLGAYRNELGAQAGKALTAGGAALLQSISESL
jgi:Tol biopolymer transport system component